MMVIGRTWFCGKLTLLLFWFSVTVNASEKGKGRGRAADYSTGGQKGSNAKYKDLTNSLLHD